MQQRSNWLVLALFVTLFLLISGAALSQEEHAIGNRAESDRESPIPLNPAAGAEVGFIYEAF